MEIGEGGVGFSFFLLLERFGSVFAAFVIFTLENHVLARMFKRY